MTLVLALLLDALLGEPRALWDRLPHPAVLLGRAVAGLDRRLNRGRFRLLRGTLALVVLIAGALAVGIVLAALPGRWAEVIAAAVLLAQRSLADHVAAVADALHLSLPEGRRAVARIVGRDTAGMDAADVTRAAVESAAENLSDGVVAPAVWFALAGLPGLIVYKAVNTADSMIGYRTPRYEAFGKPAARLDDFMNLAPARLTALLIRLVAPGRGSWRPIAAEARRHRSPNAGWPEAAMARATGLALSGPRSYHGRRTDDPFVNPRGRRDGGPDDIRQAVRRLWQVWACLVLLAALGGFAIG